MRRMALVCCALWLVAGAGCASQPQAPGAAKPWYQLGSWKKTPAPVAQPQLQVSDIRDMNTAGATAGAPGMPSAMAAGMPTGGMPAGMPAGMHGQQPGMASAGMASASSGQQY